jgi:hypothetical protein
MNAAGYDTLEAWRADCPWEIVEDEETGAGLPRPPGWETLHAPETRILLRQHDALPGRFAWTVAVTVERPEDPYSDVAAYTTAMIHNMSLGLTDLRVIAIDPVEFWGREGRRVLSAHRAGPYAVALEQYWFVSGGVATTLSGSCDVADHLRAIDVFGYLAHGLSPADRLPGEPR